MEKYITNAVPPKPEVKFCRVIVRNIIKILFKTMLFFWFLVIEVLVRFEGGIEIGVS